MDSSGTPPPTPNKFPFSADVENLGWFLKCPGFILDFPADTKANIVLPSDSSSGLFSNAFWQRCDIILKKTKRTQLHKQFYYSMSHWPIVTMAVLGQIHQICATHLDQAFIPQLKNISFNYLIRVLLPQ